MERLDVSVRGEHHALSFEPGPSLREILDAGGLRVRTGCIGFGACGLCRVRVLGSAAAPTAAERLHIDPARLAAGERLACQLYPAGALAVELLNPAPPSVWRGIPRQAVPREGWPAAPAGGTGAAAGVAQPLGLAVDVGTTHLCLTLLRLGDGSVLAQRRGPNPQAPFGGDVMSRLVAARSDPAAAARMAALVRSALAEAMRDIAVREGIDPRRVVRLALVGNSAMTALLAGDGWQALLDPARWLAPLPPLPPPVGWGEALGLHPECRAELVAPLAGFVGSDLLAGLVATGLTEGAAPALLIDLGTNSELALWDGRALWVTSAAGGPAFELSGLSHGMPAEEGAIYRVEAGAEGLRWRVIGDGPPRGWCGSGLVDLVARLLERGTLTATGRFDPPLPGGAFPLAPASPAAEAALHLTLADVDALQQGKAAIATGLGLLCDRAGIAPGALRRLCVAGEFGRYLGIGSAQRIGLLPPLPAQRVELWGNTALLGAGDLLLSAAARGYVERLRAAARALNLACTAGFAERFLENLYLRPLPPP